MDKPDHHTNWNVRQPPKLGLPAPQQQPRRVADTLPRYDVCPRCHVVHFNEDSRRLCVETRQTL